MEKEMVLLIIYCSSVIYALKYSINEKLEEYMEIYQTCTYFIYRVRLHSVIYFKMLFALAFFLILIVWLQTLFCIEYTSSNMLPITLYKKKTFKSYTLCIQLLSFYIWCNLAFIISITTSSVFIHSSNKDLEMY